MSVRVERDGPVATVVLDRRERRNAVESGEGERGAARFRAGEGRHGHGTA